MYLCTRCGKPIKADASDPVNVTSLGRHHTKCMLAAWDEKNREKTERRSEGQKRRWAKARGEESEENGQHGT